MLYNDNEPWKKKNTCFDVTMVPKSASLLASIYYLYYQINLIKQSTGLYRDDGLELLRNTSKHKTDRIRKDIIEIFKKAVFKIEIKQIHILLTFWT